MNRSKTELKKTKMEKNAYYMLVSYCDLKFLQSETVFKNKNPQKLNTYTPNWGTNLRLYNDGKTIVTHFYLLWRKPFYFLLWNEAHWDSFFLMHSKKIDLWLCVLNTQSFFLFLLIFLPACKESNRIWYMLCLKIGKVGLDFMVLNSFEGLWWKSVAFLWLNIKSPRIVAACVAW